MTTATDSLWTSLRDFQADAPHIPLDSTNPHFRSKFASLPDVTRIVRPKLAEHGLVWTTLPSRDENGPTLRYKLAHAASGEAIEGEMPLMLTKQDPQGLGSAITYARRYSLLAVLGLVGDDDDDGNAGSQRDTPPSSYGRPQNAAAPRDVARAVRQQATASDVPVHASEFTHAPERQTIDPAFCSDLYDQAAAKCSSVAEFRAALAEAKIPAPDDLRSKDARLAFLSTLTVAEGTALTVVLGGAQDAPEGAQEAAA